MVLCRSLCRQLPSGQHSFQGAVFTVRGCYVWMARAVADEGGVVREASLEIGLLWQDDTD